MRKYYCCLDDYAKKAPTESLLYPTNKLELKEASAAQRKPHWVEVHTGRRMLKA